MKKYLCITIASLLTLIACDKEARVQEEVSEIEPAAEKLVTITASIPVDGLNTKVSITEADNGEGKMRLTKLSWEEGDEIIVNTKSFTVKPGSISGDGLIATFQGKDPGSGPYNITYTNVPGDPNNQEQPADGDPSDVGYSVSLTGADTYEGATFSSAWASSHGATFAQSSVLQLRALLPAAVAAGVKKVIFKSTANIFNGSNTLTVTLTSAGTTGTDNKLDVYAMLPAGDITLSADMDLLVQFEMDGGKAYDKYTAFRHFASGTKFVQSGCTKYMGLDCSNIAMHAGPSTCDGSTAVKAYLIGDQHQMQAISLTTTKQYYKLVDDIDMTSVSWTSLNAEGTKIIDLNGNSKKISNMRAPLFADLNGNIYNLTLYNSVVSSAETVGILANTCNTAASTVSGVTVTGDTPTGDPLRYSSTLTSTATSLRKYVGGLVGEVSSASTFDDCHVVNTSVTGITDYDYTYTGGVIGYIHKEKNTNVVLNSTVEISAICSHSYTGGLIGYYERGVVKNNKVGYDKDGNEKKCFVSGTGDCKGGLIGQHNKGYVNDNTVFCEVIGGNYLGGLTGRMSQGSLSGNSTSGSVSGGQRIGGLVGHMDDGTIDGSHSSVTVSFTAYYAGGLLGSFSKGSIQNSYATGSVTNTTTNQNYAHAGGLIGIMDGGTVTKCYSIGNVSGKGNNDGGLIGRVTNGTIMKCYAEGNVTSTRSNRADRIGGFIGGTYGTVSISDCYAIGAVSGTNNCSAFIGYCEASTTTTINNSYTKSTVSATSPGALIGNNAGSIDGSGFIAWWASGLMIGTGNAHSLSTSYIGTSGSIYSQAVALGGWDFVNVWTTDAEPKLR